jgi:hypothetical protein
LRKRIFPFAEASTIKNSTDRKLFIDALIKELDKGIDESLERYVKNKAKYALDIKNPVQIKSMYEETLSYIKFIKSNMLDVTKKFTNERMEAEKIEQESIALLKNIDQSVNKNLHAYVRDKAEHALNIKDPAQIKSMYEETLSYIQSIKSTMPIVAKNLTNELMGKERIEQESIALLKDIDKNINKSVGEHVRDNINNILETGDRVQLEKIYKEMLAYIKSVRSNMPAIAKNLTKEQIESEAVDILIEELVDICAASKLIYKQIIEKQVLVEPASTQFKKRIDEVIKTAIFEFEKLKKEKQDLEYSQAQMADELDRQSRKKYHWATMGAVIGFLGANH